MPVDWKSILGILTALSLSAAPALGAETETLRAALHSDLKIVDPIWTTALISVHHGYMIYDTLFALDDKLEVRPQMVERPRDRARTSSPGPSCSATASNGMTASRSRPRTASPRSSAGARATPWGRSFCPSSPASRRRMRRPSG